MNGDNELTRDITMCFHNAHSKNARIHRRTTFLAQKREVEHRRDCTSRRILPFLPLKHTETREYLQIPHHITTENQLWDYVGEKKPFWLDQRSRRDRRNHR